MRYEGIADYLAWGERFHSPVGGECHKAEHRCNQKEIP